MLLVLRSHTGSQAAKLRESLGRFRNENTVHAEGNKTYLVVGGQMVLLYAFIKKSQGTPQPDLEIARTRKNQL